MKLSHIDHVNIVVSDLEAAVSFFDMLGFIKQAGANLKGEWLNAVVGLDGVKAEFASMHLEGAQTVVELLRYDQPINISEPGDGAANQLGYRHIGIVVDDVDAWHTHLTKKGIECFSPTQDVPNYRGKRLFYFRGPENIILEFTEFGE